MKSKSARLISIALALLLPAPAAWSAPKPDELDCAFAIGLVTAIEKADYAWFVANGDSAFQQLKQEQFAAVAAQLSPRLKAGYELTYLGELRQQGCHVTLWRVRFSDGGDDALATLSLKAGKVGGFWIR
jgi:hypothetical protein